VSSEKLQLLAAEVGKALGSYVYLKKRHEIYSSIGNKILPKVFAPIT
jgi:hypothetical protein